MSLSNIGPIVSIQQGNNVFLYGTPTENRTPIYRMKICCPNH